MSVVDLSGNGTGPDVGGASRPGWSLWKATADGDGAAVPWAGGAGTVVVAGTLGGGTVTIKTSFMGKTPNTKLIVPNTDQLNITTAGTYDFRLSACDIIANLAGATSASCSVAIGGYDL
jgi:hypothetical protein